MEREESLFTPLEATFATQLGVACRRVKEIKTIFDANPKDVPLNIKLEIKNSGEVILIENIDDTFLRGMQKCIFSRYEDLKEEHPLLAMAIVQDKL